MNEYNRRAIKNPDSTMRQALVLHLLLLHALTQPNQDAVLNLLPIIFLTNSSFEDKPPVVSTVERHCHH